MERFCELMALLERSTKVEQIDAFRDDIAKILPPVSVMFDFDQSHSAHPYDLWTHTLVTLVKIEKGLDSMVYLGALLHDIGKPSSRINPTDKDPSAHYFGHPKKSYEIVKEEIVPLIQHKLSEDDIHRLLYYVLYHDDHITLDRDCVLKYTKDVEFETFMNLLRLEIADAYAHNPTDDQVLRVQRCTRMLNGMAKELTLK